MSGIQLKLDEECWRCYGNGRTFQNWKESSGDFVRCDSCNGTGRTLTEIGREIVDLVKRHLLDKAND